MTTTHEIVQNSNLEYFRDEKSARAILSGRFADSHSPLTEADFQEFLCPEEDNNGRIRYSFNWTAYCEAKKKKTTEELYPVNPHDLHERLINAQKLKHSPRW